jgi:hypothetical protein
MGMPTRRNLTYRSQNTVAGCENTINTLNQHLDTLNGELKDVSNVEALQNAIANGSTNRAYVSAGGKNVAVKNPEEVFAFVQILHDINATGFDAFLNLKKSTVDMVDKHARDLARHNDKISDLVVIAEETIRTLTMDQVRLETQEEMASSQVVPAVQAEPAIKLQAVMVPSTVDDDSLTNLLNTYGTVTLAGRTFLQVPPNDLEMVKQIINAPALAEVPPAEA